MAASYQPTVGQNTVVSRFHQLQQPLVCPPGSKITAAASNCGTVRGEGLRKGSALTFPTSDLLFRQLYEVKAAGRMVGKARARTMARSRSGVLYYNTVTNVVLSTEAAVVRVIHVLGEKFPVERIESATDLPNLVEYFLNLDIAEAEVVEIFVKAPALLKSNLDEDIRSKFDYLVSHGASLSEINTAVLKWPSILRAEHMTEAVSLLLDMGVAPSKLGSVIAAFPNALTLSKATLLSTVEFLQGPYIGIVNVGRCIEKEPQLLGRSVITLTKRSEYLQTLLPDVNVGKMLSIYPGILKRTEKKLEEKVTCLKKIFPQHESVHRVIEANPHLLLSSPINYEETAAQFQDLYGDEDAYRILTYSPMLLGRKWEQNIQPKLNFLVEVIGLDLREVVVYPQYLAYSLEQRIKPRTANLKAAGYHFRSAHNKAAAGEEHHTSVTLYQAFAPTHSVFASKFLSGKLE